jgi:putative transposase
MRIFGNSGDYYAFEKALAQSCDRTDVRLLAYCLMPNHWHLVLWPRHDGELSSFMYWLTMTHTQRWHANRNSVGGGHLYQGRFKSFPIQNDGHFLTVCRYVERNAVQAKLVSKAQDWQWCSLWQRMQGNSENQLKLSAWPVARPDDWLKLVDAGQSDEDVKIVKQCIMRERPFGSRKWLMRMVNRFGLETTIRPKGRPRNKN